MNILHLEASPGWGGQEIRILREAEGMRARGHQVVLAVMHGGKLVHEAHRAGFTVYEIAFQKTHWFLTLPRLLTIMQRHHITIVNTHSSLDSWIGGIAARFLRIPIVRTRHLSTSIKKGWNSRWLYGSLADFIVTTCSEILPMISSQAKKPLSSMQCIATGVDPARMQVTQEEAAMFRKSLHLSSEYFLVGTACFMRSWKGIYDLLEAAHLLRDTPYLRWVIIGGGHEEAYRKRASDLHLSEIVHFTGHLHNPMPALLALDVFTLLSTAHEGVSQAILQAAYLAKPLIATRVGGLCEVCLNGETGIEVPSFTASSVAQAVIGLMQDEESCHRFGNNAKNLVLRKFMLEHTLSAMEQVYQKLVLKSLSK